MAADVKYLERVFSVARMEQKSVDKFTVKYYNHEPRNKK
jgi:hypothetical protein